MKIGISDLDGMPFVVRTGLEELEEQIRAGWSQQHKGDGSHGNISATGCAVDGTTRLNGRVNIGASTGLFGLAIVDAPTITANTNNWQPGGIADALIVIVRSDAARDLTGIVTSRTGRLLLLQNLGGFTITLKHNVTSTAEYRFSLPNGADLAIRSGGGCVLWYHVTERRWFAAYQ